MNLKEDLEMIRRVLILSLMTCMAFPVGWAADNVGITYTDPATGMEFVFVKGGCYRMGDTFGDGENNENPVHEVCVSVFYIGKYNVTVGQFNRFVSETGYTTEAQKETGYTPEAQKGTKGKSGCNSNEGEGNFGYSWRNPGFPLDDRHPVVCISWNDAVAFTEWQGRKTGKGIRLPSEAEWEYACRGGGGSEKYCGGNDIDSVAWYKDNSGMQTHPVGQKRPNGLGLYDMSGNAGQWMGDWYDDNYYGSSGRDNPRGPSYGHSRALRGGSWAFEPRKMRASTRGGCSPSVQSDNIGLRAVFSDSE